MSKGSINPYLSKSLYIRGLQCHKSLWLQKYRPELKDEVSPSAQVIFDTGTDVGLLAQDLFPGGSLVPYEGLTITEQINKTNKLIAEGVQTIYEASFSNDSVFIKIDILHRGTEGWELYEVKGSTSPKEVYLNDIALQFFILEGAGLKPHKAFLVHINRDYVRNGAIEPEKLFTIVDVSTEIQERQKNVFNNMKEMRFMLQAEMPDTDIGPHCDSPYECPFCGHCWSHIPSPSVFDYADRGRPDAFELYKHGIIKMEDVPLEKLGWRQKLQHEGALFKNDFINYSKLKDFINSLWYPICFMDFETTYMNPVPLFDGTRPYQQVPFQYSLHIMDSPDAELKHIEFISEGRENPQKLFFNNLLKDVPENACVLTWNQAFESGRIKELKAAFPDKESKADKLLGNIRDLMIPFREKTIYLWQFNGSYSIKAVLPALCPDLSYKDLKINNGEMAASAWNAMLKTDDIEVKEKIKKQLLIYCHLDTYAMVKILEEMRKLVAVL